MADLCTSPNHTGGQSRRKLLSLSSGHAWWIPGSNLLLKTAGAGEPTLSPGDCCHSLMTHFQQCNLASARILSPAAGHEAEERPFVSFSLRHLSEGCSAAPALLKSGQDASQHRPVPPPAQKHAQNPPAQHCVDFGFPPGGLVQLLVTDSSEAVTSSPVRRRRRRKREAGAGAGEPVLQPSAKNRFQAAVATCVLQHPAGKNLHIPAS